MTPKQLQTWMRRNGWSVVGLAVGYQVSERTIYRWRDGSTDIPRSVELSLDVLNEQTPRDARVLGDPERSRSASQRTRREREALLRVG